jgi:hypothetical protein
MMRIVKDGMWPTAGVGSGVVALLLACFTASALAALPEGRVYEMVTPPGHAAHEVGEQAVASGGEAVGYGSAGAFAGSMASLELGNGYLATRSSGDWSTVALDPPATLAPASEPEDHVLFEQSFPDDWAPTNPPISVGVVKFSPNDSTLTRSALVVYRREADGALVEASPVLHGIAASPVENDRTVFEVAYKTASADLSHIILRSFVGALIPSDPGKNEDLYEVDGTAAPAKLVGVNNDGGVVNASCPISLGAKGISAFHAMSADGSKVFFTTNVEPLAGSNCDEPGGGRTNPANPAQLFVRADGARTVEISKPISEAGACGESIPCPGAKSRASSDFQGASLDGSKVFFTTTQPLVSDDTDTTNDLYMAEISPSGDVTGLLLVSGGDASDPSPGHGAGVRAVTSIAGDGSHVYFIARGVLTTAPNGLGQAAVAGAENLFTYDTTAGTTKFVAELCSGPATSGEASDGRCPSGLDTQEGVKLVNGENVQPVNDSLHWVSEMRHPAQTTPDSRFLVFDTYARLVNTGTEADTDSALDIYRYDTQTGGIVRVSVGEGGYDANGNGGFNAAIPAPPFGKEELKDQYELNTRAVTADGSTVVFTTSEPLSSLAGNGQPDIYVWHEGHVGLISSGNSLEPDEGPVITLSGRDIFFQSSQALLPRDANGVSDVYDARIGGGFTVAPVPAGECSGAACQGPPSMPSLLAAPSSATFSGLGNLASSALGPATKANKPKPKPKSKHKEHRRKRGRPKGKRHAGGAKKSSAGVKGRG